MNVAVIGAGTMGPGIALAFSQFNHKVNLVDIDDGALRKALDRITVNLQVFVEKGIINSEKAADAKNNIRLMTSLSEGVSDVDYVTEAVHEVLDTKKKVFQQLDSLSPANTILTSNTSSMSIDDIASNVRRRDKCVVTHWVRPPQIMQLVEIVKGKETSEQTVRKTKQILEGIGKKPVVLERDWPGFINNYLLFAMRHAAYTLHEMGVASVQDIDTAIKTGFGLRSAAYGVFEQLDMGGLDVGVKIDKETGEVLGDPDGGIYMRTGDSTYKIPDSIKKKVKAGEFGVKTGKGFYDYHGKDKGAFEREVTSCLLDLLKTLKRL